MSLSWSLKKKEVVKIDAVLRKNPQPFAFLLLYMKNQWKQKKSSRKYPFYLIPNPSHVLFFIPIQNSWHLAKHKKKKAPDCICYI